MNVARVTVRATIQGLMMRRDFGLVAGRAFLWIGGATAGIVATGGSNTAWLAKIGRPFPLPQRADVSGDVTDLYMTIVLYLQSDVLEGPGGSDICVFETDQDLDWRLGPRPFDTGVRERPDEDVA
jgi:hypothetical protein